MGLRPRVTMQVCVPGVHIGVASGAVHVSLTLTVLHSSRSQGFFLGGRTISVLWLRGSPHGGIRDQASGDRCMKTQARIRIRAEGHARSNLLALRPATWVDDCRLGLCQNEY